jgi:uncharacterized protein (DUF1810 family)
VKVLNENGALLATPSCETSILVMQFVFIRCYYFLLLLFKACSLRPFRYAIRPFQESRCQLRHRPAGCLVHTHCSHTLHCVEHHYSFVERGALGTRKKMKWDPSASAFVNDGESNFKAKQMIKEHFFPGGILSEDYYRYAAWRAAQRLVSATNSVFGTQALILALGFKRSRIG